MMSRLMGNHTGPRQLELPPNMVLSRFPGKIVHFQVLAGDIEDVRVLIVDFGHGADAWSDRNSDFRRTCTAKPAPAGSARPGRKCCG